MTYPPADDRLTHLIAQEINPHVVSWKFAFWLAQGIVKDPAVQAEIRRIGKAHAAGQSCGDRNCEACWNARLEPYRPIGHHTYEGDGTEPCRTVLFGQPCEGAEAEHVLSEHRLTNEEKKDIP